MEREATIPHECAETEVVEIPPPSGYVTGADRTEWLLTSETVLLPEGSQAALTAIEVVAAEQPRKIILFGMPRESFGYGRRG